MGGFLGIGGSSAKTDRRQTLTSYEQLNNLYNFGLATGKSGVDTGRATTAQGVSGLSSSQAYWQKLMSGNRPALEQAVAPETNAVQSQGDAARRNAAATGTARGGGTAGANEQQKTDQMARIDNLLFGVRPQAAQQEAAVSGEIANVGTTEMQQALEALGLSASSAGANLSGSITSRPISQKINQDTVNSIKQFAAAVISGGMGGGGMGGAMGGALGV